MLVFTSYSTILSSSLISHHRFQTIQMVLLQAYNHMPHHTILEAFLCHSSHRVDSGTIPFDSKSPKHRSGHETLACFNSSFALQTRRLMGDTSRKGESWWKCCRAHATVRRRRKSSLSHDCYRLIHNGTLSFKKRKVPAPGWWLHDEATGKVVGRKLMKL